MGDGVDRWTKKGDRDAQFGRAYQQYLKEMKDKFGAELNPDPYNPKHFYRYRDLWNDTGGIRPDSAGHLPSKYKVEGHPRQYIGGVDTRTGQPQSTPFMEPMLNSPRQDLRQEIIRAPQRWNSGPISYENIAKADREDPFLQDLKKRVYALATGGGFGGFTKVLRNPNGLNAIKAFHNTTGQEVGRMGYRQIPGRGGRIMDIKVDPSVRGQGYGRELVEGFENEMGPLMNDTGLASSITNSPGFWGSLANRWQAHPIGRGIRTALEFGGF
jgi:GNAT superfamily N-acetyltransferase